MTNVAEKSILAKLLATENISVEHKKVQTAYFDLATRTVVLPIWKDMSADLYDLLIGHEVGHALNTPKEGWHDAVCDRGRGFKGFLNIIEDARIERMQKEKYPGLRRSFYNGYKELFQKNFFGVEGMDVNKLKLIDRINLHFKIGGFLNVQFTAEEQVFIDRIMATQTWDDVVTIASDLYDRAELSDEESQFEQFLDMMESMMDDDQDMEMPSGSGDTEETEEPEDADGEAPAGNEPTDEKSDLDEQADADDSAESSDAETEESEDDADADADADEFGDDAGGDADYSDQEPSSFTDDKFREKEDSLLDASARENTYARLGKLNPADFILSADYFHDNVKIAPPYYAPEKFDPDIASKLYSEFLAKNNKYLNAMVQDFERKKMAKVFARASTSKTGRINMDKIWAYKLTDDVFLQNTIVPDGKNHGILMFLDMSGSMRSNIKGTMEQLVLLASFCKKVRIPFEVYGFTNNHKVPDEYYMSLESRLDLTNEKNIRIDNHSFRLMQLVTTNVSASKFKTQMKNLLVYGNAFESRYSWDAVYSLSSESESAIGLNSSTPLEETVMVGRYLADEFRNRYRVEVLSTVFLTDGDGDAHFECVDRTNRIGYNNLAITDAKTNITIVEPSTGGSFSRYYGSNRRMLSTALLKLYKESTGSRVINFFVADRRQVKYYVGDLESFGYLTYEEKMAVNKAFREGTAVLKNQSGFDTQFIIKGGNDLNTEEDTIEVEDGAAKGQILRAFKKMQNKKGTSRAVLTQMIEAVA